MNMLRSPTKKPCKACTGFGHTAFNCPRKPRKAMAAKKPMKKQGKHFKKWIKTRNKWLEIDKAEYYVCHYCPQVMTRSQLTLDHYQSRGRHPEMRYSFRNLVPCCLPCNSAKGSLSGDEYIERLKNVHTQG